MVNKERVTLWVDGLLDPTLVQGEGRLAFRDNDNEPWKQCCLDVACRVAMANGLELEEVTARNPGGQWTKRGYVEYRDGGNVVTNYTDLPLQVMDWYGFNTKEVVLGDAGDDERSAITLNDNERRTFPEISAILRARFLKDQK